MRNQTWPPAVLLLLVIAACGSRTAPPEKTQPRGVSTCGECGESQSCVSYFLIGEPEAEKSSCERRCVPGDDTCGTDNECTMDANGPGLVCRPTPKTPVVDRPTQNVVDLIRLWGDIRYSHPSAVGALVDWDAAFLDHVLAAAAALDDRVYFKVVEKMLGRLGDPNTRIAKKAEPPTGPGLSHKWNGSRLAVDFGAGSITGLAQLRMLQKELEKATEVVFDLRGLNSDSRWRMVFVMKMLGPSLIGSTIELPSERTLLHQGYKPHGLGSTFYYTALEETLPELIEPSDEGDGKSKRVVFVLGTDSPLPAIAVPLWHNGVAQIVATQKTVANALEPSKSIALRDREIRVRVGQATFKGRPLSIVADAVDAVAPIKSADALLRGPSKKQPLAPAASGQSLTWQTDKAFDDGKVPTPALTLLAVARLWTVINIFYPYKELIGDWTRVLPEYVAAAQRVATWETYVTLIATMAARVHDDHTGITGPKHAAIFGKARAPFEVRVLHGAVVVSKIFDPKRAPDVRIGDVLLEASGRSVAQLWNERKPFVASSTPARRKFVVMNASLRGQPDEKRSMTFESADGKKKTVEVTLLPDDWQPTLATELPYRILEPGIGYVDLRELTVPQVDSMLEALKETRAIIMDMRGYPRGTAFKLAPKIARSDSKLAMSLIEIPTIRSTNDFDVPPDMLAFVQRLDGETERYPGETVMLIDERAISQSEHSGLGFQSANGTRFIGTETAGANGDITSLSLPGGLNMRFTGLRIRHADGRQLQRVGLIPDVRVEATVEGMRQGKDEVLETALGVLRQTP